MNTCYLAAAMSRLGTTVRKVPHKYFLVRCGCSFFALCKPFKDSTHSFISKTG